MSDEQGLRKEDWQAALDVQSACNLSGVVFSFAQIMERLCREVGAMQGTAWKNGHPICRLFAEQIMHLTSQTSYHEAYQECVREARG